MVRRHHVSGHWRNIDDFGNQTWVTDHERGGGCCTCVVAYGTPVANELDIIRNWRDSFLRSNFLGRDFIKSYYSLSPYVADFIKDKPILRKFVRGFLYPIVALLKHFGYENKEV